MFKQILTILLAALMAACGGGGGGSNSSAGGSAGPSSSGGGGSSDTMSFSPSLVSLSYATGTSAQFQVSATPGNPSEFSGINPILIQIVDSRGVLVPNSLSLQQNGYTVTAYMATSPSLVPGTYTGTFQVVACANSSCTSQVPGSPWGLPYNIQVTPGKLSIFSQYGSANTSYGSGTASVPLSIQGTDVNWTVTTNQSWITPSITSGSGSQNIKLNLSAAGLALDTYAATVTVTSTDGQVATETVLMNVVPISTLKVTPVQPTALIANAGTSQVVTYYQVQGLGLTLSVSADAAWAQPVLTGGMLLLNLNTASLAAGSYFANVTVKSADGQSAIVPVSITVYAANTPLIELYAGATGASTGPLDGPAPLARFVAPLALTSDAAGNLYLLDNASYDNVSIPFENVREITSAGIVNTPALNLETNGLDALVLDSAGNIYVSDPLHRMIDEITSAHISYLATSVTTANVMAMPGPLAIDSQNNVYVYDTQLYQLQKITPDGTAHVVATLGNASATVGSAGYSQPAALAVDQSGNVLFADAGNFTIRKVSPLGQVTVLAGQAGVVGTADGIGSAATFHSPTSIVMNAAGDFYVADFNCIRKVSAQGVVTTIAGTPSASLTPFNSGPLPGSLGPVTSLALRGTSLYFLTGSAVGVLTNVP